MENVMEVEINSKTYHINAKDILTKTAAYLSGASMYAAAKAVFNAIVELSPSVKFKPFVKLGGTIISAIAGMATMIEVRDFFEDAKPQHFFNRDASAKDKTEEEI